MNEAGVDDVSNLAVLVSAPDGYRTLVPGGELFLAPQGNNIIIADTVDGEPITEDGNFILVLLQDLSVDMWVLAVERI